MIMCGFSPMGKLNNESLSISSLCDAFNLNDRSVTGGKCL